MSDCLFITFKEPELIIRFEDCGNQLSITLEKEVVHIRFPKQVITFFEPLRFQAESFTVENTNSETYETILILNIDIVPEGDYKIDWGFLWTTEVSNKQIEVRILIDGNEEWLMENSASNSNTRNSAAGFLIKNLSLDTHVIELQYRKRAGGPNKDVTIFDRIISFEKW